MRSKADSPSAALGSAFERRREPTVQCVPSLLTTSSKILEKSKNFYVETLTYEKFEQLSMLKDGSLNRKLLWKN